MILCEVEHDNEMQAQAAAAKQLILALRGEAGNFAATQPWAEPEYFQQQ